MEVHEETIKLVVWWPQECTRTAIKTEILFFYPEHTGTVHVAQQLPLNGRDGPKVKITSEEELPR